VGKIIVLYILIFKFLDSNLEDNNLLSLNFYSQRLYTSTLICGKPKINN
jgi:hypothetical protein